MSPCLNQKIQSTPFSPISLQPDCHYLASNQFWEIPPACKKIDICQLCWQLDGLPFLCNRTDCIFLINLTNSPFWLNLLLTQSCNEPPPNYYNTILNSNCCCSLQTLDSIDFDLEFWCNSKSKLDRNIKKCQFAS